MMSSSRPRSAFGALRRSRRGGSRSSRGRRAAAFGMRGARAESPGALALVAVLQCVENLTDRQAGLMVARAIDWKYALGLELADPGFDPSVLSKFRARLVEHGLERVVVDTMLGGLAAHGPGGAGG